MSMMRWEPFNDLMSLREAMDRLFEDSFVRPGRMLSQVGLGGIGGFPLDVWQTDQDVFVKMSVPGVKPDDLEVNLTGEVLTIRGEVKQEENVDRQSYVHQERRFGQFQRTVTLPCPVEADQTEATFEHGVLTLRLSKAKIAQPRRIAVRAGAEPSRQMIDVEAQQASRQGGTR